MNSLIIKGMAGILVATFVYALVMRFFSPDGRVPPSQGARIACSLIAGLAAAVTYWCVSELMK